MFVSIFLAHAVRGSSDPILQSARDSPFLRHVRRLLLEASAGWAKCISSRIIRRHGWTIRIGRVGKPSFRVGIDMPVFDGPSRILVLLCQDFRDFLVSLLTKVIARAAASSVRSPAANATLSARRQRERKCPEPGSSSPTTAWGVSFFIGTGIRHQFPDRTNGNSGMLGIGRRIDPP